MESFKGLAEHSIIGIDTAVFIYHLEAHPTYLPKTTVLLNMVQSGQFQAITSTVTLLELTVHPWKKGREDVARRYEALLMNFPNLTILSVDRHVARKAAQLRAQFNLSPPDALHIGTAVTHGATAWVSNDKGHRRVAKMLNVILLDGAS